MTMEKDEFKYEERLRGRKIRLIRLTSMTPEDELDIRLETVPLDHASYEALSYVWGDGSDKVEVTCNGKQLRITRNLFEALKRRKVSELVEMSYENNATNDQKASAPSSRSPFSEWLWADAICINQADTTEKTEQVRLMKDIYSNAERVIVWFGESNDEDNRDYKAVSFGTWLYDHISRSFNAFDLSAPEGVTFQPLVPQFPDILSWPQWDTVFELLSHPWFTRIWVVQELLLAKRVIAVRGWLLFEMRTVLWLARLVTDYKDLISMAARYNCRPAGMMAQLWQRYLIAGPLPIFGWVKACRLMDATDERDRFFALAGISKSVHPSFINYEHHFETVVKWVGLEALLGSPTEPELQHGPDHLAVAANPDNRKYGLPSWLPDFTSKDTGGFDLAYAYMTVMLAQYRPVPKVEIRGLETLQVPDPKSNVIDNLVYINEALIAFKASQIDVIQNIESHNTKEDEDEELSPAPVLGSIRGDKAIGQLFQRNKASLAKLFARRRLANQSLSSNDDITSGDDFDTFVEALYYNYDPYAYKASMSIQTSFLCWVLLIKFFLMCYASKNLGRFYEHQRLLVSLGARFESAYTRFGSRRFFVTDAGRPGWAPLRAVPGDKIFIFQGSRIPFVARPVGNDGWEYIGACFLHGVMDGEAWELPGNKWFFMRLV